MKWVTVGGCDAIRPPAWHMLAIMHTQKTYTSTAKQLVGNRTDKTESDRERER